MSDNKTWIKAYKGFDKDLKCKGRQYTEGVEDHVSDVAKLCKEGVHACERPLDVFRYYVPADSVYHEVELAGVLDEHQEDSKICDTDIKVKGKLDIAGLIKAQIKYTKSHCTNEYNAENGKPPVPVIVVPPRARENLVWAKMELRAAAPIMRV